MSGFKIVRVPLADGGYPVLCGAGFLARQNAWAETEKSFWEKYVTSSGITVAVSNETIWNLHGDKIENMFADAASFAGVILLPDGEEYKNWHIVETILNELARRNIRRDGTVVAVGGGVIGDLAGFAAAVYMRGIRVVQVPTTLLAQVDAAIGGKTGVNSEHGKNMFGAFHQPAAVVCDTAFLQTLPPRDYCSGLAEVVKYALLGDEEFFIWLEKNAANLRACESDSTRYAVEKSVQAKADIVAADERETGGQRALLNLGHTFAHGLETAAGYGVYLHGEAVACGLVAAAKLSEKLSGFAAADTARIIALLQQFALPTSFGEARFAKVSADKIMTAMAMDKKHTADAHYFVLMNKIGEAERVAAALPVVREVLADMQ